ESIATVAVANRIEIIDARVSQEVRDRRVEVASVQDARHVYDQIVDVQKDIGIGNGGIVDAERVFPLQAKIVGIVAKVQGRGSVKQSRKSVEVAVGGVDRIRTGLDFDDIVIRGSASEIIGGILGFR